MAVDRDVDREQVEAGLAVYTPTTLALYDFLVLGLSTRLIWRCPTSRLLGHYNTHVSANHLDVGVGTGFFLDRCDYRSTAPRIGLMDFNRQSLDYAANRIARYRPETYYHNVLEPIDLSVDPFQSVGLNYLLHCLPGSLARKSVVFEHLAQLMLPEAILFGATLLQGDIPRTRLAKRLMSVYNRRGIFSNTADDLAELESALKGRFATVSIEVVGCAALFAARR